MTERHHDNNPIPGYLAAREFQKPAPFPFSIGRNFSLPLNKYGIINKMEVATIIE